jgi:tetratricopeptide (TPR) repeat protein
MICPKCKNETWGDLTCPKCGLSEAEAFLLRGDIYLSGNKYMLAVEYYEKYLEKFRENIEVSQRRTICYCKEACRFYYPALFTLAVKMLEKNLADNSNWEIGHLEQINMYFLFGKLEELKNKYLEKLETDLVNKNQVEKYLKTIILMEKFSNEANGSVNNNLTEVNQKLLLFKSLWFLPLTLPLIIWGILKVIYLSKVEEQDKLIVFSLFVLLMGIMILIILFLSAYIYRKNLKRNIQELNQ